MDGYGGGGVIGDSSKLQDLKPFGANPTGDSLFDASQYAFFGNDVVEEVELGGLEDEEEDLAPVGFEEEEFQLGREEGSALGSLSEVDDLSSTFAKLNNGVSGRTNAGVSRDWGSRESSSAAEWAQEPGFTNLYDQRFDTENINENKKWSSQQYSASGHHMEAQSLHRTSSYPEQQQQQQQYQHHHQNPHQHYSSDPILIPKSPFTSYPPPGGRSQQASPNSQPSHLNNPHPNLSPFSNSPLQLNAVPHGPQFGGNLPQLPHGLPVNSQLQNQWANQSSLYPGNRSGLGNNISPHQNGLMPPQPMPPQQVRMHQPSLGHHISGLQPQLFSPHLSASPPMIHNFEMHGLPDLRDQRAISMLRSRQVMRYPNQGLNSGNSGWPRFRAKYMSPNEIENILRMQLAATHSNDPYVEDYYHQACLARKSSGSKMRHHFYPTNLRENASKPHATNEPHPFLKVDALGRVSFSSIRRPRPLLEVDSSNSSNGPEPKLSEKPLEQEPMLAARVTIEDGICLLLDVDDIDRYLQFNQLQDVGGQLRQRRQVLLEGLASSLQLVDPLGKNGHGVNLAPEDDFVFLTILSLPKGRKLLSRFLQHLLPGELTRVVCMAVFRNLRFLFGNNPQNPQASVITANLAKAVSSCVHVMELKSLAACLASVVCCIEHPPLRPIGSPSGDGASVILISLLERSTELLTYPRAGGNCSPADRAFWQASFDAFFGLLTKYCFNKYDSVVQIVLAEGSPDNTTVGSDLAKAIGREMPVEVLRVSLPHTSEPQRKVLLEFAQRSIL